MKSRTKKLVISWVATFVLSVTIALGSVFWGTPIEAVVAKKVWWIIVSGLLILAFAIATFILLSTLLIKPEKTG